MYYNMTVFFTICCCTYWIDHQCYESENFSQHYHSIKVDHFEGFLNWSNSDELVINSTSECNCNSYKLNKLTITNLSII